MEIFSLVLFALSCNVDNFVIGISYGVKKIKITTFANIVIAFMTFFGTAVSMFIGRHFFSFIPIHMTKLVGSTILICIGIYYLAKYFYNKIFKNIDEAWPTNNPEKYDHDNSGNIDIREAAILGLALTINNMGLGIAGSISGLAIFSASILTFVLSICAIFFGNALGSAWISKIIGKYAEPIVGAIIILLGLFELLF